MRKFMPLPVSTCTEDGTASCSNSSWYSCHTQPMYTPVAAAGTSAPAASASCGTHLLISGLKAPAAAGTPAIRSLCTRLWPRPAPPHRLTARPAAGRMKSESVRHMQPMYMPVPPPLAPPRPPSARLQNTISRLVPVLNCTRLLIVSKMYMPPPKPPHPHSHAMPTAAWPSTVAWPHITFDVSIWSLVASNEGDTTMRSVP